MSMGGGAVTSFYCKHKMNGRSSTKAEIIGTHDAIQQVQWTNHFMEAQGYDITKNIMYQDNKSAILLDSNGKMSISKRTKHIHVRLFNIKDVIERCDMSVEYCPTGEMWADIFTNPLQGIAFKKIRAMLMNCPVEYAETVFEDIEKIAGVHKPNFYPFPSRSAKYVIFGNASPQECVGGVSEQQDSQ